MPELPEVETTVQGLHARVLNRTFVDVWTDWQKMVKKPNSFALFEKELKGRKILRVWRRAKNVVFELSGGWSLLIHMKMTGHLLVGKWRQEGGTWVAEKEGPLQERINGFLHIIFSLDDGRMIALSDMRKFAKVELVPNEELVRGFEALGPEPLEKDFAFEKFKPLFLKKRGRVKQVIMVPEFIAGVGNIYASEALWLAKIHPQKDVSKLDSKELQRLYDAIRKVLEAGVQLGGESFDDYRNVDGEKGKFDDERRVYQRHGETCMRCNKAKIERLMFGGRSAFYCPNCQKLR